MRLRAYRFVTCFTACVSLLGHAQSALAQAGFHWLPAAPRPEGIAQDLVSARGFSVSEDGSTVAGYSAVHDWSLYGNQFGTVWSRNSAGDYTPTLLPPRSGLGSVAQRIPRVTTDVSGDGQLVAEYEGRVWDRSGGVYSPAIGGNDHATWSSGGVLRDSHRRGMSGDGQYLARSRDTLRRSALAGGYVDVPPPPDLPPQWDFWSDVSISRDGRTLAGMGTTEIYSGYDEFVWRWREGHGTERLPLNVGQTAYGILADGSVIVALASGAGRWMPDGTLIETGIPCFDVMADDGSLFASGNQLWTQSAGLTTLEAFLGPGVLPAGYLFRVDSVSANGAYLLVNGTDAATGNQVAGIVAVPAPGVFLPIASVGCVAFCRRGIRSGPSTNRPLSPRPVPKGMLLRSCRLVGTVHRDVRTARQSIEDTGGLS